MLALLLGCGGVEYRPVDLQLDVLGRVGADVETIHMCVEGVGEQTQGAGNGRVSIAALPEGEPAMVTLDFWDAEGAVIGGAGPVTIEVDVGWAEVAQDDRNEGCAIAGADPNDSTAWVLGIRFVDEPW